MSRKGIHSIFLNDSIEDKENNQKYKKSNKNVLEVEDSPMLDAKHEIGMPSNGSYVIEDSPLMILKAPLTAQNTNSNKKNLVIESSEDDEEEKEDQGSDEGSDQDTDQDTDEDETEEGKDEDLEESFVPKAKHKHQLLKHQIKDSDEDETEEEDEEDEEESVIPKPVKQIKDSDEDESDEEVEEDEEEPVRPKPVKQIKDSDEDESDEEVEEDEEEPVRPKPVKQIKDSDEDESEEEVEEDEEDEEESVRPKPVKQKLDSDEDESEEDSSSDDDESDQGSDNESVIGVKKQTEYKTLQDSDEDETDAKSQSQTNITTTTDTTLFNDSFDNIKSNITHLGKTDSNSAMNNSNDIIELSDTESNDIASSTQYQFNLTTSQPKTPLKPLKTDQADGLDKTPISKIQEFEKKPLASWSPNFEKAKLKVKESMQKKESEAREIEVIDLDDEENFKVEKKMSMALKEENKTAKYQAPSSRGAATRITNRDMFNEEKLKLLSERMMEVMEDKPDPAHIEQAKSPKGLRVNLLPHQFYSMLWLKWREANYPNGGILADDMGLGKTLTILSYLKLVKDEREAKLNEKNNDEDDEPDNDDDEEEMHSKEYLRKLNFKKKHSSKKHIVYRLKTLIVLPASLLFQWQGEIQSKFEQDVFKIHVYHDANRKKFAYNLDDNDIVFTTYEIVSREIDFDKEGNQLSNDSPLTRVKWKRIILDEAHRIKNHTTKANKAMCALKAKYRFAITGTPIHNSLNDLYSLIKFLHFAPLDEISLWKYVFASETASAKSNPNSANAVERQKRLDSWMAFLADYLILRRTKSDKLHGSDRNIVDLPKKNIEIVRVTLSSEEKAIYEKIFEESKEKVKTFLLNQQNRMLGKASNSQSGSAVTDIFVYLLRLRQACCHLSLLSECLDKKELQSMKVEAQGIDDMLESLSLNATTEDTNKLAAVTSNANLSHCLKKSFVSSKLGKLIQMVEDVLRENLEDKLIIVSQWTSVLSLVSAYLKKKQIDFCEINGDVNLMRRNEIVESFNKREDTNLRVMLLSLTAGGVGLNLVGANRMFLLDIHWNPALEQQAMDRIYRVGQTKNVSIYRFLCENTIEQRIEQIQHFKIEIAQKICGPSASNIPGMAANVGNAKLTLQDFRLLFKDFDNKD